MPEQADRIRQELAVVGEFMPEQMGRAELEGLITSLIEQNDFGLQDLTPTQPG